MDGEMRTIERMSTRYTTAYNVQQKMGRLRRQVAHYTNRVASIGEPVNSTQKRAATLAMKCLRRSVRDLDSLAKTTTSISRTTIVEAVA
jgi:hypothetical protein